jgi:mRNA-degrading endonuclease YafQ of YafQ-DinJ toxin-antitoxin module
VARELIILQRFKRDYRNARKHAEFDAETLEYVFDALISGERLPSALREHRLWTARRRCEWRAPIDSARVGTSARTNMAPVS